MMSAAGYLHKRLNPKDRPSPVLTHRFKRGGLARTLNALGLRKGAEIGVADGRYSHYLCTNIDDIELLCVDPWEKYHGNPRGGPQTQHDGNYEKAQERLAPYNATLVKAFSMDAVRDVPLESLDWIYVDANHSFDWVMQDIIEWAKRVKRGGIVAGHDYYSFRWAGVCEAVNAYTRAHNVKEWFVTDEREPSFFWAKRTRKDVAEGMR